jgi:hypothetical protein
MNTRIHSNAHGSGGSGGSGGAPTDAQYVVLALNGTLTQERVLAITSGQLFLVDSGANTSVKLSVDKRLIEVMAC